MSKARIRQSNKKSPPSPLMVRLDDESKNAVTQAAELRRISVSDYVRTVTVAQARREVASAQDRTIVLTPDEQLAFWQALRIRSTDWGHSSSRAGAARLLRGRADLRLCRGYSRLR